MNPRNYYTFYLQVTDGETNNMMHAVNSYTSGGS